MQKAMIFNNVAIFYVKGSVYRIHFQYMSKDDAINKMVLDWLVKGGFYDIFFIICKK